MIVDRGPFRRKGIERYVKLMSTPNRRAVVDYKVKRVLEKKFHLSGEFEPASLYDPSKLFEALKVFGQKEKFVWDEHWDKAYAKAKAVFGKRDNWAPLVPNKQAYLTKLKMEKSGGIYLCNKAGSIAAAEQRVWMVLRGLKRLNPCLAFARTQYGKEGRLVWGYPTDAAILESRFGFQLIEVFKQIKTPFVYSLRRIELGARLDASMRGRNIVGLDFSKFDSTVPAALIRAAFRILRTWFEFDGDDEVAWREVVNYFINTPIVMPDGHLYTGKVRGVPSGSLFTQLIDSVVNYMLVRAAGYKFGLNIPDGCVHVMGDDSLFSTNSAVDLNSLREFYLKIGMSLSVEKCDVYKPTEGFKFVGVVWKRGIPHFDEKRIFRSGVYPERRRDYRKLKGADGLMIDAFVMKTVVLPLFSIGVEGARILAKSAGYPGPASIFTMDLSVDDKTNLPGYLRYQLEYDDAADSGLWTPIAFPFSA
jgi:hypothetical protein